MGAKGLYCCKKHSLCRNSDGGGGDLRGTIETMLRCAARMGCAQAVLCSDAALGALGAILPPPDQRPGTVAEPTAHSSRNRRSRAMKPSG